MAGQLFIISAPSGGGKTSLVRALLKELPNVSVAVSYTTRPPRPGDREGVDYYFVTQEVFEQKIAAGDFWEYAKVFGNWYGTPKKEVQARLTQDEDVILEIDWQGAAHIRALTPCCSIFILPPSMQVLETRLRARQQDSAAVINGRLAAARTEISHFSEYDFLVVNDVFEQAFTELKSIFQAQRLRQVAQAKRLSRLLEDVLGSGG